LQVGVREGRETPPPPEEEPGPPPEVEEESAADTHGIANRPEVQTLMEVFDGKIHDGDQRS